MTFNAINGCYRDGTLTSPLKTGINHLLRKGQKDSTLTGNYRPIYLLSIHYKLASCCIKQRLRPMVGIVKGQQQKAYVLGNVTGSCIINILNLMKYTNRKKIESLILLIDFRKAFESLSQKYIDKCLKIFNFDSPLGDGSHSSSTTERPTMQALHPPQGRGEYITLFPNNPFGKSFQLFNLLGRVSCFTIKCILLQISSFM